MKNINRKKALEAAAIGSTVVGAILGMIPASPVTKVLSGVFSESVPRVLRWFSMPAAKIQDDALYKTLRRPLRSRILLEVEREKRAGR